MRAGLVEATLRAGPDPVQGWHMVPHCWAARGGVEPPTFQFKIDFSGHVREPLDTACYLRRGRPGHPAGSGHWWPFPGGSWG